MKRNPTFQKIACMLAAILIGGSLFAQTYNVPGDFTNVTAAVEAIKANGSITAGAEVTINVAEGVFEEGTINQVLKAIKLTIQGAGADKTILKGLEGRPVPGAGDALLNKRFFILQNQILNDGFELIMKGIKFKNWGVQLNGGLVLFGGPQNLSVSLIDCEFEGLAARAGAVVQSNDMLHGVTIDNCFIHNCLSFDSNNLKGLLNFAGTGKISITNSTFMSNEQNVLNVGNTDNGTDRNLREGLVITMNQGGGNPIVTIENNVFVNNRVVDAGSTESVKPIISIVSNPENVNPNYVIGMKNNVFIGNGRAGNNKDVDLYYYDATTTRLIFQNPEGNILNSFVKLESEANVPVENAGFLVNASYTYIDPRIGFVMDGDLPKVHYDDKGVGYLIYNGDGTGGDPSSVNELPLNSLVIYSLNGVVNIKGLNIGEVVEVYSLTGSLVAKEPAYSEQLSIALPRGLFIVRSGVQVSKVLVH